MNYVKHVVDNFKRDIEQGFSTRDKVFAIELLEKALEGSPMETAPKDKEILAWCPPEFQIVSWDEERSLWDNQNCRRVAPERWWPLPEKTK